MIENFEEWTNETEGLEKQQGKLPGLNQLMGTLPTQDDDVGIRYKNAFKGLDNYRDKMPYGLRNAAIM